MVPVNDGDTCPADKTVSLNLIAGKAEPRTTMNTGTITLNIFLSCSGTELGNHPRADMNKKISSHSSETQIVTNAHALPP